MALHVVGAESTRPFDVVESKIHPPQLRSGVVSRTALVNRLRTAAWAPLTTICAPAGYGKTTLLAQWASRDSRPFAWLTGTDSDNDPLALVRGLAGAIDVIQPLDGHLQEIFRPLRPSSWSVAAARLGSAVRSLPAPFVLVVDDSHLLRSRDSLQALTTLIEHVSEGSTVVLAGRDTPRLPIATLRARGLLREVGEDELALSRREAQLLLRSIGVDLGRAEISELVTRCEGWAAALYLAGLSIQDESDAGEARDRIRKFRGDDTYVTDFVRLECLSDVDPESLRFLRRTSILERMCGPLCDAIVDDEGSSRELEKIDRSHLFLVRLDNRRGWYRYRRLFRDVLQRELTETEPRSIPRLHRRAADWYEAHGDSESALKHAFAGGDIERTARILTAIALPTCWSGRVATVEAWLRRFDEPSLLDRFPAVAQQGSWVHALRGRAADAERWLVAAENATAEERPPDGRSSHGPGTAVIRAAMCGEDVDRMLAEAETALAGLPPDSLLRASAQNVLGAAHLLLGQTVQADAIFAEAADEARRVGDAAAQVLAISERSLLAFDRGDGTAADAFAVEARGLVERSELAGYVTSAIALAVSARTRLRNGHLTEARGDLARAENLRPLSERSAFPWLTAQALLELAHVYLALRDRCALETLLTEIDEVLRARPDLGVLPDRVEVLRREVGMLPAETRGHLPGLTVAELRLLPLLATHLSFSEIGARLYVSRNTVKTQAISIYRRLGVSSRSDAISEADRLGLIDLTNVSSRALAITR
jgi:LuxR family transcriptional regulator, maltose regulon positive regulatory protein